MPTTPPPPTHVFSADGRYIGKDMQQINQHWTWFSDQNYPQLKLVYFLKKKISFDCEFLVVSQSAHSRATKKDIKVFVTINSKIKLSSASATFLHTPPVKQSNIRKHSCLWAGEILLWRANDPSNAIPEKQMELFKGTCRRLTKCEFC